MKDLKERFWQYYKEYWPLVLLLGLVFLFFWKFFVLKLIPIPADLIVGGYFPWFDYKWGTIVGVPIKNSFLTDAVSIVYPLRFYAAELIKSGQLPLWNSRTLTGYPLIASFPTQIFFPTFIFWLLISSPVAWTLQIICQILVGATGMYLLTRSLGLKPIPSLFAAVSYSFGGFSMVWMEWNVVVTASSILPFIIYFLNKFLTSKDLKWGVGFSIALGLQFLAGYPPVCIFSALAVVIWVLLMRPGWSGIIKVGLFSILGATIAAIQLLPGLELFLLSQRKFEVVATSTVFTQLKYLVTFLAPNFFGNPATGNFWGPVNYLQVCFYCGIVTLILGVFGVSLIKKEKTVKIALVLFFTTVVIVFDNPISRLLYNIGIWGGNSMTMDKAMFLGNFSLAILGAFGLSRISKIKIRGIIFLVLPIALITTGLLAICFFLKPSNPNLSISFRNLFIPTFLSWVVFFVLLVKLRPKIKEVLLLITLTSELFYFGWKFNPFTSPKYLYPETPVINFLQENSSSRFASEMIVMPPDMFVPFGLSSLDGSDSYYPEGVAKLIAVANSGNIMASPQTKGGGLSNFSSVILERMATKYFVTVKRDAKWGINPNGEFLDPVFYDPKFEKVFEDGSVLVFENKNALPHVFFVDKILQTSEGDILSKLNDKNFSARSIALSQDIKANFGKGAAEGNAEYSKLSNSHIEITTKNNTDSFLVVLDAYYPGWCATIDSIPVKIYRTNFAFQGVLVPAGKHEIDFIYRPNSLKYGLFISLSSGLIIVILAFYEGLNNHSKLQRRKSA